MLVCPLDFCAAIFLAFFLPLPPEEIRTLRESLGLSQPEFIAELGLKCDRETARKRAWS